MKHAGSSNEKGSDTAADTEGRTAGGFFSAGFFSAGGRTAAPSTPTRDAGVSAAVGAGTAAG